MKVEVAIIGAGSAGLSARREVAKHTDSYVVIDDGPLGTTCARVGCMPSKVLIQVASDFHRRHAFGAEGIGGAEALSVDDAAVMRHVRKLRDRFVRGVLGDVEGFEDHILRGRARFASPEELVVTTAEGEQRVHAKQTIIATGSKPVIPEPWRELSDLLIDTDGFFELERLPRRVAVIGLGVIGLELGQALHRLGVEVHAFTLDKALGGLSDPEVQDEAFRILQDELPVTLAGVDRLARDGDGLRIEAAGETHRFDRALVAMGRRPVLAELGLGDIGVPLDDRGMPSVDPGTFVIPDTSIFVAGDVLATRPVLHEASDEGRIAGYNAATGEMQCFKRRAGLVITFGEPNIAVVGKRHAELVAEGVDFVTGAVGYRGQGRAIIKGMEHGRLHVYARRGDGRLLGAELAAPDGEHLAHLLSWALAAGLGVRDMLAMPFYHPVIEEGLRTALRGAAQALSASAGSLELLRCQDPPVGCWS